MFFKNLIFYMLLDIKQLSLRKMETLKEAKKEKLKTKKIEKIELWKNKTQLRGINICLQDIYIELDDNSFGPPPIGPVSASIGIAVSPNLLKVFKYAKNILLYDFFASSSFKSKE